MGRGYGQVAGTVFLLILSEVTDRVPVCGAKRRLMDLAVAWGRILLGLSFIEAEKLWSDAGDMLLADEPNRLLSESGWSSLTLDPLINI